MSVKSFLTEHGEDEVLGRVDLQCALVVVFALIVFAEFLDESVQFIHPASGPEIELRCADEPVVDGVVGCSSRAAAR